MLRREGLTVPIAFVKEGRKTGRKAGRTKGRKDDDNDAAEDGDDDGDDNDGNDDGDDGGNEGNCGNENYDGGDDGDDNGGTLRKCSYVTHTSLPLPGVEADISVVAVMKASRERLERSAPT